LKKDKRIKKKIDRLKSKKQKYEKFRKGKDKRVQNINEEVSKIKPKADMSIIFENEKKIDEFFKKNIKKNIKW
jgi:hypothetical protein